MTVWACRKGLYRIEWTECYFVVDMYANIYIFVSPFIQEVHVDR